MKKLTKGGYVYILLIAIFWLLTISINTEITNIKSAFEVTSTLLFILLTHGIAFLPISRQKKLLGTTSIFPKYPEILGLLFVSLSWCGIIAISDDMSAIVTSGILALSGPILGYASLKIITYVARYAAQLAEPNPQPGLKNLFRIILKYSFSLHVLAVSFSLFSSFATVLFNEAVLGLAVCSSISGICAIALAGAGGQALITRAKNYRHTADAVITSTEVGSEAAEVILYCSDSPTAKHVRIGALTNALGAEHISVGIIAREAYSMPALKKMGAPYLWLATQIGALDALARPSIQAVMYTHDGIKNGHFIRFNQFAHILDATTGTISKMDSLPQGIDMYDFIIAPNYHTAQNWRSALTERQAARILTWDRSGTALLPKVGGSAHNPIIGMHVDRLPKENHVDALIYKIIDALVAQHLTLVGAGSTDIESDNLPSKLHISVPDQKNPDTTVLYKRLLSVVQDEPYISLDNNNPDEVWNTADIIIVTPADDLARLRMTGKPLLWVGPSPAPQGTIALNIDEPFDIIDIANQALPQSDPLHFNSIGDLLAYAVCRKQEMTLS